ncbi:amyA [Symbiodinium necroappetens]|uniref:Alpha-amylase n=1 Tax=Symbiodinium necroappetens TaxID=1628268 RepID=A0A813C0U1_9DINO|nr:amyA [Symbiodinium necroappetens]|mmetsp:Transcript_16790/g.39831  ORF Transcript_16790/g.39831 Transcript_16790/m.39831 type:complete len:673 (-) Transcript_16790:269-2287(-)|eukprot:CAMPEP_0181418642 /NCGR_PEP_ID=MMETSP1110-20121109/11664_1 /TAXON_ID=174948 /ORGANISM="Symbiodinium sp., Strain CCMP421" /LENGTH=672 /DNA_ID=CAMNT_0023541635 /DNA_START=40 /DNA_END=2058 /DNA_ORIENTATION=+
MVFLCFKGFIRWLQGKCGRRSLKVPTSTSKVVANRNYASWPLRSGLDFDLANDEASRPRRSWSSWFFGGSGQDSNRSETTEETAFHDHDIEEMSDDQYDSPTQPRTIFHALHLSFEEIRQILPELAWKGFDAVQIPPAQLSPRGDLRQHWYLRYQPLSHLEIDPALGGYEGLQRLCEDAANLRVMVIADCVFNHMAVVASCSEWREAQEDHGKLEELKGRLDRTFGPQLDRNDFQWPWVCLEGHKWDDPNYMFEGWGCGEWSELRFSDKVVNLHLEHLRQLLDCGVSGFRLDAAKHMRPAHVARYVDYVQQEGGFVYTEVLSMDRHLHSQYDKLGKGVPSTDFKVAAAIRNAWRCKNAGGMVSQLSAAESLGHHSVQFVRNHDTMLNDGPAICGIDWRSAEDAALPWAYLIARSEGSVLMHQDDANCPVVQAALGFRAALAPYNLKCEMRAWPPPQFETMQVLLTLSDCPIGLAVFNVSSKSLDFGLPWALEGFSLQEVKAPTPPCEALQAGCSLSELDRRIRPRDARFFLLECTGGPVPAPNPDLHYMTLFYFSGWDAPHVHFSIDNVWTESPGWPLRKSEKPSIRGCPEWTFVFCLKCKGSKIPRPNSHGRWWRIDIPVQKSSSMEFVLNDRGMSWDNAVHGGNYMAQMPGLHILAEGKLASFRKEQGRS